MQVEPAATQPTIVDLAMAQINEIEKEHPHAMADARRYRTLSGPLRAAYAASLDLLMEHPLAATVPAVGPLFARTFQLMVFENQTTASTVANDPMIAALVRGEAPAGDASEMAVAPGDLHGAIEAVLKECLLPWGAKVERSNGNVIATLSKEDAGAAPLSATIRVHVEDASAWTCTLGLVAPNFLPTATFHVEQRRGMKALMRRKREGKEGAELVKAIFSTTSNEAGDQVLDRMAPVLTKLENDDVTAKLEEKTLTLTLPFLPATPSDIKRGATLAATAWDALFHAAG